jgi:hypothetical protein
MADLARKPPQNLDEFMSKAEKYINQEETFQALLGPKQAHTSAFEPRKKKRDSWKEERRDNREGEGSRSKRD